MSKFSDTLIISGKILYLAVRTPGLLISANRRYRQFRQSFLQETDVMGIPADVAGEMLDGLKPAHLYSGLRSSRVKKQTKPTADQPNSTSG
jgi:hypothetical protein